MKAPGSQENTPPTAEQIESMRRLITNYFGAEMLDRVLDGSADLLGEGQNCTATILIFDLRRSTGIAEKLKPDVFSQFLSEMFTDIMDLIYGHSGVVNKLLGDGILATFGVPNSDGDDARHAAVCALQIRDYLKTFNDVLPPYLDEPIAGGIGLATGRLFAGTVGSIRHREYAILGDPVNLASRLEQLTKKGPFDILIDEATHAALGGGAQVRRLKLDRVRGRVESLQVYALDGLKQ